MRKLCGIQFSRLTKHIKVSMLAITFLRMKYVHRLLDTPIKFQFLFVHIDEQMKESRNVGINVDKLHLRSCLKARRSRNSYNLCLYFQLLRKLY